MQRIRCIVENTTKVLANGILAHHQIHFDIPYALSELNNSGVFIYGDATGDNTTRIASEPSLTPSMPMTKVLIQSLKGLMRACHHAYMPISIDRGIRG